ncbi:Vitamin K epoxide reductase family protein [uncultured archaeon]|nr:Vitamin K epoxide reductase family protein [uncultured archaeon]
MKTNKVLGLIIIALIILEIILCGYILNKESKPKNSCILGESCSEVQESAYGKVFGTPWAYIGIAAFFLLLVSYFINNKIFRIATCLGSIVSFYLIFIQLFVIKNICINCMEVHAVMFLILILSFIRK